jgi:type II secretory pathway component PulM
MLNRKDAMLSLSKRMEELLEAVGRLSQRERYMVAGVIVSFIVFVTFLIAWLVSSSLTSIEHRLQDKTGKLQTIIDKRTQFEEARQAQSLSEQRIRQGSNVQLYSVIEGLAQQSGVNIGDMQSRPSPPDANSNILEDKVEVNIPLITIDRLVQLIEQIERKADTIAVRRLHIKKSFKDPSQLEVSFTVSNFLLIEKKEQRRPEDVNLDASAPDAELPR